MYDRNVGKTLENYSAVDPVLLGDDNDATDSVQVNHMSFTRIIDVTVNANRSRTVNISVQSNSEQIATAANVSNSFALWDKR